MKLPARTLLIFLLFFCAVPTVAQTSGGIGAMLKLDTVIDGTTLPRIQALVPNGPAATQHLPEGSYIIKVNEQPCKNKSLEDVVNIIRGDVGTAVKISIADNAEGKKAKTYSITRAIIQTAPPATPPGDPLEQFNKACEQEFKTLKKKGHTIVKNTASDCGSYYFSFDADNNMYQLRVYVLMSGDAANAVGANAYDNSTETNAVPLRTGAPRALGTDNFYSLECELSMKQNSVGMIKTFTPGTGSVAKCKGMYVIIYK
jgi:membrane-associated protease RseP (regulator of RpoE activity)